jgi:hypothetical protein
MNKKEDPVVETRTRNIKNNVTLPVNVDTLTVIILSLEHVKNYLNNPHNKFLQTHINNHPHNQLRQIATPTLV